MFKSKKLFIVIVVLLAGGYIVKGYLTPPTSPNVTKPQPTTMGMMQAFPVSAAEVIEKEINETSKFSGRLEAVDNVEIKTRVSGNIVKIHFQDGAVVKKGEPLITIDQAPYLAEVDKAKGAVAAADSAYQNAMTDFTRAKSLLASSSISKRDYDSRDNNVRVTEGNLKTAKANLDSAQLNLDYTIIKSPISGKVSRAEITEGNYINSGLNTPTLTRIVSISPIYASFEVDEQTFLKNIYNVPADDLKKIPVKIGLANDAEQNILGQIQSFDNQLNVASGTIRVRALIDNADGKLIPGLFAKVNLGSAQNKKAILVNEKAVGTDQSKKFVFVVSAQNTAEYREVTLGQNIDGLRVVNSGLNSGEKIIVNGITMLRPNTPVQPEIVDMITLTGNASPQPVTGAQPSEK
jgi:membrane fusion protein, multidrug efflux system